MRCSGITAALLSIALVAGCGDGGQEQDDNVLSYMGLKVGTSWSYGVDVGAVELDYWDNGLLESEALLPIAAVIGRLNQLLEGSGSGDG